MASEEAAVDGDWKRRIVVADSEDAVKVEFANEIFPSEGPGGYGTLQRVLRTPFVAAWNRRLDEVGREAGRLREELMTSIEEGRAHELVPFTGQSAGMIHEILPAAEIVRRMVAEAEEALRAAPQILR